jgi:tetratricopeptide (TPR) repeat protein
MIPFWAKPAILSQRKLRMKEIGKTSMRGVSRLSGPVLVILAAAAVFGATSDKPSNSKAESSPATPREYFNAGTRELKAGKLREAEAFFETVLASQQERLQTPALYNLGHVRFAEGVEELKKGPSAGASSAASKMAQMEADEAIRTADDALESNELQKIIQAYMNGRGKRREIKAAREAVLQAIKAHGATLAKWQRSSGDFKSAVELDRSQKDADFNADVVDRRIAQLVDSLKQLQQQAQTCSGKCNKLSQKLKQLKGRIPASQMPPGAGDDDDEDDDSQMGKQESQKEAPSKEGKEMNLSPEQAGWLLEGFKLDNERRLPMGQMSAGQPKDQSRKPW